MLQEKIDTLTRKKNALDAARTALAADAENAVPKFKSMAAFCEAAGFHPAQVSRWFTGKQEPEMDSLKVFLFALVTAGLMTEECFETHCG